jgi:pectate lyase
MKTITRLQASLAAGLALLAAGCGADVAPEQSTGIVTVSVGLASARTLLPQPDTLYYTLLFSRGAAEVPASIAPGSLTKSVSLQEGQWDLQVHGYASQQAAGVSDPVLSGAVAGISVVSGGGTTVTVPLSKGTASGNGTLAYSVSFPAEVTAATLSLVPYAGGETVSIDLKAGAQGTRALAAGYWIASAALFEGAASKAGRTDLAHVYAGMTTPLTWTFSAGDFSDYSVSAANKAALEAAISAAQAAPEGITVAESASLVPAGDHWVTQDEREALDAALTAAQIVNGNPNATQNQVDNAAVALNTAVETFNTAAQKTGTKAADKTALTAAITAANSAKTGIETSVDGADVHVSLQWVTAAVLQTFNEAITAAQAVNSNALATQAQVNEAKNTLQQATIDFNAAKQAGTDEAGPEPLAVTITKNIGWLNAAAVEWTPPAGHADKVDHYEVACKANGALDSAYTTIDAPLVRNYGTYWRADVMGIAAGTYDIRVLPVLKSTVNAVQYVAQPTAAPGIAVQSHDRSGYAFANGKVPGAYKIDGTPKTNARVIYVADSNKDTVALECTQDGPTKPITKVGLQNIIDGHKKGNETRPLIIRMIGQVTTPTTNYSGDIVFENKNADNCYITMEGVGNDATADGWGIRMKGASNIEVSNIGFMNTDSDEGDDVGLQSKNYYIWVHNCDLFYGKAGSDSDQAKGDGAMDSKGSTYVTMAYNHFWDNGKTHLVGNKENGPDGGPGLLSIHHNWYDHSDSRHPRVRVHTVHVYNNYYDGVAKYGIGATYGCSVFAEANYFRGTSKPMMISMQGTDIAGGGGGTFSSEAGGIIKAYGNVMEGSPSFVPYSSNNVEFDAYVTAARDDTVPSSVTTKQGSNIYNNFDTASGFYTYTVESAAEARTKVQNLAGRMEHGDFSFTFTSSDDSSYAVNTALQSALVGYHTTLVSVPGISNDSNAANDDGEGVGDGEAEPDPDDGDDEPGDGGDGGTTGSGLSSAATCSFDSNGTPSNSAFTLGGSKTNKNGPVTVNNVSYSTGIKFDSNGKLTFETAVAMTLTLYFATSNSGNTITITSAGTAVDYTIPSTGIVTAAIPAGAQQMVRKASESQLYYIAVSP